MRLSDGVPKCQACGKQHFTGVPEDCREKILKMTDDEIGFHPVEKRGKVPAKEKPMPKTEIELPRDATGGSLISLRLEDGLLREIEDARGDMTRSAWIRAAIEKALEDG